MKLSDDEESSSVSLDGLQAQCQPLSTAGCRFTAVPPSRSAAIRILFFVVHGQALFKNEIYVLSAHGSVCVDTVSLFSLCFLLLHAFYEIPQSEFKLSSQGLFEITFLS